MDYVPRTAFGRKLVALRNKALAAGMRLFSEDEVLDEVKHRRGELEENEMDIGAIRDRDLFGPPYR